MELKHVVTQVVGFALAAFAVVSAWRANAREVASRRVPLMSGAFSVRTLLVVLGGFVPLVPVLWLIFSQELVPRGSPVLFAAMLAWVCATFLGGIFAVMPQVVRRDARGWLWLEGSTLHVEAEGEVAALALTPGCVRLRFASAPAPGAWVQLEVSDGARVVHVWGMLALPDISLVTEGQPVPVRGLMLGGSSRHVLKWLKPFLTK